VSSLPPKYRDVTVLYYFQDEDLAETSRIMSLPSGTVKARLHRARKMLETKLSAVLDTGKLQEAH
jgi:RNA polymerase sigma-70 factor (ECF subfamily)